MYMCVYCLVFIFTCSLKMDSLGCNTMLIYCFLFCGTLQSTTPNLISKLPNLSEHPPFSEKSLHWYPGWLKLLLRHKELSIFFYCLPEVQESPLSFIPFYWIIHFSLLRSTMCNAVQSSAGICFLFQLFYI